MHLLLTESIFSVCLCQNCKDDFDLHTITFDHRVLKLINASIANWVYLLCVYVGTAKMTMTDSPPLPWLRAQSSKTYQCIYCKLSLYSPCLCRNRKDDFDLQPITFEHRVLRLINASIPNWVYILGVYVKTAFTSLTYSPRHLSTDF